MRILGIETSCDETSLALLDADSRSLRLRTHVIASQAALHRRYGGVVPEVAARKHSEVLQPLLARSIGRKKLASIDCVAVTAGPGLVTSLMIGVQTAKTISFFLKKPLIGINHLEAHIYANWLTRSELHRHPAAHFPALVLIVSGGHTLLVLMNGHSRYRILGTTLDDAAGESFDKVAKILGLGYPGGPVISRLAEKGNPHAIAFPRPLLQSRDYNVSFSGLKTAVLYYLEKRKVIPRREIPDIAASFQQAVVDVLMRKVARAAAEWSPRSLMLAGGVAANTRLRSALQSYGDARHLPVFVPRFEFTGDNAAMIAAAGYFRRREARRDAWRTLSFDAQLPLL